MKIRYLIACLLFSVQVWAQNNTGTVSGFVYDRANGEAVIGANVYFEELPIGSSTNLSGYYIIPQVTAGSYTLVTEYLGYKTDTRQIEISSGENIKLNIELQEEILESEVITVVADSIPTIQRMYNKTISEVKLTARQINRIPQIAEADLLRVGVAVA